MSLASRFTSRSRTERGPVGIVDVRLSAAAAFGVKKLVPDSDSGGLDLKLDPKDDRGPDGTLGGMILSDICVTGALGSGFCSIFFGKSSVGEGTLRVDCGTDSGLTRGTPLDMRSALGPLGG
jgi:hypothetical protein